MISNLFDLLPVQTPLTESVLLLLLFVIAAKLIDLIVNKIVKAKLAPLTKSDLVDKLISALHAPITLTITLIGIYFSIRHYGISERYYFYFNGFMRTLMILIWTFSAIKVSKILVNLLMKLSGKLKYGEEEFIPLVDNILRIIIYLTGLLLLLHTWKVNITPFLASAGIVGIVIGFAARESISDFFGGVTIFLDQPYKLGDWLILETGEEGEVSDIGVRSTRLKTRDNSEIIIPNSKMASKEITNISAPEKRLRIKSEIGVAYGSDIDQVDQTLKEIAEKNEEIADDPSPEVRFEEFGDSSLNFALLYWIDDPVRGPKVKNNTNREIYEALNEVGIEIPFPQRDIHLEREEGN